MGVKNPEVKGGVASKRENSYCASNSTILTLEFLFPKLNLPAELSYTLARVFCIIGAEKSEIQKIGKTKRQKSLHSFSSNDLVHVEPISEDPKSPDFMAFRVMKTKKNKPRELSRFEPITSSICETSWQALGGVALVSSHLKVMTRCLVRASGISLASLRRWMGGKVGEWLQTQPQ